MSLRDCPIRMFVTAGVDVTGPSNWSGVELDRGRDRVAEDGIRKGCNSGREIFFDSRRVGDGVGGVGGEGSGGDDEGRAGEEAAEAKSDVEGRCILEAEVGTDGDRRGDLCTGWSVATGDDVTDGGGRKSSSRSRLLSNSSSRSFSSSRLCSASRNPLRRRIVDPALSSSESESAMAKRTVERCPGAGEARTSDSSSVSSTSSSSLAVSDATTLSSSDTDIEEDE